MSKKTETNAYEFEILEGGTYPKKYRNMACEDCGWPTKNWKGMHREHEFFTDSHEYVTLRCDNCNWIMVWFRVFVGEML